TSRQRLDDRVERLHLGLRQMVALRGQRLIAAGGRLSKGLLQAPLDKARERLDDSLPRLQQALQRRMERETRHIESLAGRLEGHHQAIQNAKAYGYVLVRDAAGRHIDSAQGIAVGDALTLEFHDGNVPVVAGGKPQPHPSEPTKARPKKAPTPGQG